MGIRFVIPIATALLFALGSTATAQFEASVDGDSSSDYDTPAPAPALIVDPAPPPAAPVDDYDNEPAGGGEAAGGANPLFGAPSDHDQVVDHWSIAYFGILGVPIGTPGGPNGADVVQAPVIGTRYWMDGDMGVDLGLGLGFGTTGGTAFSPMTADRDLAQTGAFALAVHGGIPFSVWSGGHYNAVVIPNLNFGFSNGISDPDPTAGTDDEFASGFMLSMGVRAGAEMHLEFLDLPQATIQVTFGAGLAYETRSQEDDQEAGASNGAFTIRTSALSLTDFIQSGINVFFYL